MEPKHYTEFESGWKYPNFSPREIACRGTGLLVVDERSMNRLVSLRKMLGKPIIINSAYRSPQHNAKIGGVKKSQHLLGKAFDISMANHDPIEFENAARACGFTGIGRYRAQGFMHIDTGPSRSWGKEWPQEVGLFQGAPEVPPHATMEKGKGLVGGVLGSGTLAGIFTQVQSSFGFENGLPDIGVDPIKVIGIVCLIGIGYLAYRYLWASDETSMDIDIDTFPGDPPNQGSGEMRPDRAATVNITADVVNVSKGGITPKALENSDLSVKPQGPPK